MARKTLTRTDEQTLIHTTNGVDTMTEAVYVKELKPYDKPLPNGFNAELAEDVYQLISTYQSLWDQNVWRRDLSGAMGHEWATMLELNGRGDADTLQRELGELRTFQQDMTNPTCGTAMCLAGWVGEMTGADWVIDAKVLRRDKLRVSPEERISHMSSVLVPKAEWGGWLSEQGVKAELWPSSGGALAQHLAARGFSKDKHVIIMVSEYAAFRLGITPKVYDAAPLFDGSNSLSDIRQIIDGHIANGADHWADPAEVSADV